MYSEADLTRAETGRKRALNTAYVLGGVTLLLVVCGMIFRIKLLAQAAAILGFCAVYGWCALKFVPWRDYLHFLREMQSGLRRETEGAFVSAGGEARMIDGVRVRDLMLDAGQDADLLFYWDDEKPRPDFQPGQRLKVTSFGKFITSYEEIGQT